MRESEFSELRDYAEYPEGCIDMGYQPSTSLIRKGWLRQIIPGCWQITPAGSEAFAAVIAGTAALKADSEESP